MVDLSGINWLRQRADGYDEARLIDEKIGDLIKKFPIEQNPIFWMTFSRTVRTFLKIIDAVIKDTMTKSRVP